MKPGEAPPGEGATDVSTPVTARCENHAGARRVTMESQGERTAPSAAALLLVAAWLPFCDAAGPRRLLCSGAGNPVAASDAVAAAVGAPAAAAAAWPAASKLALSLRCGMDGSRPGIGGCGMLCRRSNLNQFEFSRSPEVEFAELQTLQHRG